ncbi:MAG: pilus assembly protein N-terminal domain-containing protein [Archangium sp.]|nr:pilus assembly protein N-terminal domain-containing protein [Archangium sp.]MDP3152256.1 pilus assembly protein N-terminal domain-containing protein [Archangium sp.]MDP3570652.1 pilus assembly protein N-terminal domain-containing protein [Archangium sp.]
MSDTEEAGELSAEAKAFLAGHETTGEPSAEALERGRVRLEGAPLAVAAALMKPQQPRSRRTLFPPEVLAAAAMVSLLLGAQALYLAFRAPTAPVAEPVAEVTPVEPKREAEPAEVTNQVLEEKKEAAEAPVKVDVELNAVAAAWRQGDFEGARRLAGRLYEEGKNERTRKNFEAAALRFQKCIKADPRYHPCYRQLGSVYASIAMRDQSAVAMEQARRAYEDFLDVAPPDDAYYPKVKAILELAPAPTPIVNREVPAVIPLSLSVDGTVKLPLARPVSRLAVLDLKVIEARVLGTDTVQVEGLRSGKTTVTVWFIDGSRTILMVEVKVSERRVERVGELFADANKALAAKDFVLASAFSKQVLELEPGHSGAQNILGQLRTQAREAYLRGYQLRDRDPAEAITWFELVVLLTPPEDETHQKALSRLRELRK